MALPCMAAASCRNASTVVFGRITRQGSLLCECAEERRDDEELAVGTRLHAVEYPAAPGNSPAEHIVHAVDSRGYHGRMVTWPLATENFSHSPLTPRMPWIRR